PPPRSTLFPYSTLFRSYGFQPLLCPGFQFEVKLGISQFIRMGHISPPFRKPAAFIAFIKRGVGTSMHFFQQLTEFFLEVFQENLDRKSTRLNSSHVKIS